jgi:hypothetical protein
VNPLNGASPSVLFLGENFNRRLLRNFDLILLLNARFNRLEPTKGFQLAWAATHAIKLHGLSSFSTRFVLFLISIATWLLS